MCNKVGFFYVFFLLLKVMFPRLEDLTDDDLLSKTVDILYHYFKMQHSRSLLYSQANYSLLPYLKFTAFKSLILHQNIAKSNLNWLTVFLKLRIKDATETDEWIWSVMKNLYSCIKSVNLSTDLLVTLAFLSPFIVCQGREKESRSTVCALA